MEKTGRRQSPPWRGKAGSEEGFGLSCGVAPICVLWLCCAVLCLALVLLWLCCVVLCLAVVLLWLGCVALCLAVVLLWLGYVALCLAMSCCGLVVSCCGLVVFVLWLGCVVLCLAVVLLWLNVYLLFCSLPFASPPFLPLPSPKALPKTTLLPRPLHPACQTALQCI